MAGIVDLDAYDVEEDAFAVSNMMQGILDRVVAVFQSYGVPLPDRQYWTMGTPAVDCAQVAVAFVQLYLGPPGDEASQPQRCNMPRTAVVTITISRQIPIVGINGKAPSAGKIQDGSVISAVDAWILMSSLNLLDQWEEGGYGPGVIATLNAQEPQGGFQSVSMNLTLAVP